MAFIGKVNNYTFRPITAIFRLLQLDILINLIKTNRHIYRMSQEECVRIREGVPYVKVYRLVPKHLCPKLNCYGDNGQWSLKLWQLLHTYSLPNTYWNWQEYVVSVMLIAVLNIKLTCEWQKSIKLNYKNTRTHVIVVLSVPSIIHDIWMPSGDVTWLTAHSGISRLHNCTVPALPLLFKVFSTSCNAVFGTHQEGLSSGTNVVWVVACVFCRCKNTIAQCCSWIDLSFIH